MADLAFHIMINNVLWGLIFPVKGRHHADIFGIRSEVHGFFETFQSCILPRSNNPG